MEKCRWCEERVEKGRMFCDELCERLHHDYWASQPTFPRFGNIERAKREKASKKNKVRSG